MSASIPSITPEDLLSHEPFVRAVARGLLSSEDAIQDVVQDTWVRALERPPRGTGALRGWLATVARNLARDHHRGEGRRRAREAAVARPEEALDISQRSIEVFGVVVDAVLALDEPYKSVVVLAYYQELTPARIAERLGRKPATVRSQLHRAHELLRERLDGEFEGGRSAWSALLLPLAAGRAGAGVSAETAGTSKLISSTWGQVAALGLVVVAAVVALPLVWTEVLALFDSSEAGSVEATAPVVAEVLIEESTAGSGDPAAGDATPVETQGDLRASVGGLDVIVRDEHGPVEGAELWFVSQEALMRADEQFGLPVMMDWLVEIERLGEHGVSDSAGRFRFPWSGEAGEIWVTTEESQVLAAVGPEFSGTVELQLGGGAPLTIRVVDASGDALVGVPVRQFAGVSGEALVAFFQPRVTDSNGEVVIRDLTSGYSIDSQQDMTMGASLAVPGAQAEMILLPEVGKPAAEVELKLGPTGRLELKVVAEDGKLLLLDGAVSIREEGRAEDDAIWERVVRGRAAFAYVGIGTALDVRLQLPGLGVDRALSIQGPERSGETAHVTLEVPTRPRVAGRAVDEKGRPLAKAKLYLEFFGAEIGWPKRVEVKTDAEGHFEAQVPESVARGAVVGLDVLRPMGLSSWQFDGRAVLGRDFTVHTGVEQLGEFVLRPIPGSFAGRCVDSNGDPVVGLG